MGGVAGKLGQLCGIIGLVDQTHSDYAKGNLSCRAKRHKTKSMDLHRPHLLDQCLGNQSSNRSAIATHKTKTWTAE